MLSQTPGRARLGVSVIDPAVGGGRLPDVVFRRDKTFMRLWKKFWLDKQG